MLIDCKCIFVCHIHKFVRVFKTFASVCDHESEAVLLSTQFGKKFGRLKKLAPWSVNIQQTKVVIAMGIIVSPPQGKCPCIVPIIAALRHCLVPVCVGGRDGVSVLSCCEGSDSVMLWSTTHTDPLLPQMRWPGGLDVDKRTLLIL